MSYTPGSLPKFLAVALNATELKAAPAEVQLLPAGEVVGRDGRQWNNSNPQNIINAFVASQQKLPIDINHSTEHKAPLGEPSPAVGWIDKIYLKNGETWASVAWNQSGEKALADKEYKYLSPVFTHTQNGEILALHSVALTNNPNLFLTALNSQSNSNNSKGDKPMSKVTKSLGLNDDASEDSIVAAINSMKNETTKALNSAKNPDILKFVPKADHDVVLNRAVVAEKSLLDIKKTAHAEQVKVAINAAVKDGKIAPASVEYHTAYCATEDGLNKFKNYIESAPKIIAEPNLAGKTPDGKVTALNDAQKEAAKALGKTEAEYLETINSTQEKK